MGAFNINTNWEHFISMIPKISSICLIILYIILHSYPLMGVVFGSFWATSFGPIHLGLVGPIYLGPLGPFYVFVTNGVKMKDGELSGTSNEAEFRYASFWF